MEIEEINEKYGECKKTKRGQLICNKHNTEKNKYQQREGKQTIGGLSAETKTKKKNFSDSWNSWKI